MAYVFWKLQNMKDFVRSMFKNPRFITPFDSQHVKAPQALVKTA